MWFRLLAAYMGHSDCLAALLGAGASADASNELGDTALMLASVRGHSECCDKLMRARVDCNRVNKQGNTPLHRAALWGQQAVARLLLGHGAHAGIRNRANVKAAGMTDDLEMKRCLSQGAVGPGGTAHLSGGGYGVADMEVRNQAPSGGASKDMSGPFFYVRGAGQANGNDY